MKRTLPIFLLLLSACSTAPRVLQTPTGLKPEQFWLDQSRRAAETKQISGKLRLRYKGREQSLGGAGRLLAQLPDQALLELRDPLGRLAYLAALEGREFVAYYPTEKRAFVGNEGGSDYFRRLLGLDAGFGDLQRLLFGLAPSAAAKGAFDSWEWDSNRGQYRGLLKHRDQVLTFFIDPKLAVLRELEVRSPGEKIHVTYDDFESCCGEIGRLGGPRTNVPLAFTVKVAMERADTAVEVEWEDITRLAKARGSEAFRVSLPKDIKKILLK